VITNDHRTQIKPVAARAAHDIKHIQKRKDKYALRTEVLRNTEFVCRSAKIFQASAYQTPFHEWSPKEDRLWTWRTRIFIDNANAKNVFGS
jgi:hypothetical protein